ncbi:hypothetical protein Skr01_35750 [Sphaerisporangium krabiense]|nr:hypothetical protein Skr01_35750 [Sphaerisporangium krabiense]
MEVRVGARLVATITVGQRIGRPPHFLFTPPGHVGVGDMEDSDSAAERIHSMRDLVGIPSDDDSERR